MVIIRQNLQQCAIDISESVTDELNKMSLPEDLTGTCVGIVVGSRGIIQQHKVLTEIIGFIRKRHADVVIIPSMGSHGGGTALGQLDILKANGLITNKESDLVVSDTDTIIPGTSSKGIDIYLDKTASRCDLLILLNRIKPHTSYSGKIQSGLCKLMTIGLGNPDGAVYYHEQFLKFGFSHVIEEVVGTAVNLFPPVIGLALIEDGFHNIAEIRAIRGNDLLDIEPLLLKKSIELMPSIPFAESTLLIVDSIGKDISGSGMDTNVIGQKQDVFQFQCKTIYVRNLSPASKGNATGIGLAEFTRESCERQIDRSITYRNCITSKSPNAAKIPVSLPSDHEVMAAIDTVHRGNPEEFSNIRIKNTDSLEFMAVSENLIGREIRTIERIKDYMGDLYDTSGNFTEIFNSLTGGKLSE